jgi:protein SCO1
MTRPVRVLSTLLLAVALVALAACSSSTGSAAKPSELTDKTGGGPYEGFGLVPPLPRPAFTLTDTSGKPFSFGTLTEGKPTLLYFGYTRCPDVCPTTMLDIHDALEQVAPTVRDKVQVVFVSTDVKHDTSVVIASWLRNFDAGLPNRFIGLSGTQVQVDTAQAAAHVQLAEDDGQLHAAEVLLYGSDDYARVQFLQSNNESDQIAHDLPLVIT